MLQHNDDDVSLPYTTTTARTNSQIQIPTKQLFGVYDREGDSKEEIIMILVNYERSNNSETKISAVQSEGHEDNLPQFLHAHACPITTRGMNYIDIPCIFHILCCDNEIPPHSSSYEDHVHINLS